MDPNVLSDPNFTQGPFKSYLLEYQKILLLTVTLLGSRSFPLNLDISMIIFTLIATHNPKLMI